MIASLAAILACQLVGETLARASGAPVPGPVIGMALLFSILLLKRGAPPALAATADGLLGHLSLLFVPAGVGLMLHLGLILDQWLPIVAALAISTALGIAVTGMLVQGLARPESGE